MLLGRRRRINSQSSLPWDSELDWYANNLESFINYHRSVVRESRQQNSRRNDSHHSQQQDYASFSNKDNQDLEGDLGLKSDDLEAVAVLYDCIRELFKEQNPEKDHLLADQFDEHVKHVMHDLTIKLNSKDTKNIMHTNVLRVICFSISNSKYYLGQIRFVRDHLQQDHRVYWWCGPKSQFYYGRYPWCSRPAFQRDYRYLPLIRAPN